MFSANLKMSDDGGIRGNTWIHLLGICALTAFCAFKVGQHSSQLFNTVSVRPSVSIASYPATSFRLSQAAVGLQEVDAPVQEPQSHGTFSAQPGSSASQVAMMYGGFLLLVGAAAAYARSIMAPRTESLALLPLVGVTTGSSEEYADDLSEIFTFENLRSAPGSRHRKKRKGRGHAAGQGATCGFGTRGQKSRKGNSVRPGFEGGQNPLWRRTPKLRGRPLGPGHKRTLYQMVSIAKLAEAAQGSTVQYDDLSGGKPILFKVGGTKDGEVVNLPSGLTVKAHAFTGSARAAIEAAGGKCVVIDKKSRELDADGKVVGAAEVAMVSCTGEIAYYKDSDVESESDMYISDESDVEDRSDIAMFAATAVRSVKVGKYKEPTPLSSKMSPKKQAIINQVNESLSNAFVVFGFSTSGYTMAQITKLRNSMPPGTKVQVVKNTLFRMASRGTGFEALDPLTMGAKAWVFIPEDSFQDAIKAYIAFLKETKKQETNPIVGGAMEGQLVDEKGVISLGDMPTKKQLIEQLARLIKGVPTKLAVAVKATPRKLAVAIRLATVGDDEDKKEASAEA